MPLTALVAHQNNVRGFTPGPVWERPRLRRRVSARHRLSWGVVGHVHAELFLTWDVQERRPAPATVGLTGGTVLRWRTHRDEEECWLLGAL